MKKDKVDSIDLELNLKGLPVNIIQAALEKMASGASVAGGVLRINSGDFIELLGYIDGNALSELEQQRLKTRAKAELERLLFNSIISSHRYHYKWCLAALNSLAIGRNIERNEESDKKNIVLDFKR